MSRYECSFHQLFIIERYNQEAFLAFNQIC